jgi:predicted DCC family thiol-disulfide oxidoreductase YuxK
MADAALFPIQVFYDASCKLCSHEMAQIKAHDHFGEIECIDCSAPDFDHQHAKAAGISRAQMMELIYARGANGKWLIGVDVFVALYEQIGLHSMSRFWGHRMLSPILRFCYPTFAKYRQPLSRLGVARIYDLLVARAAKRALANRCTEDRCER